MNNDLFIIKDLVGFVNASRVLVFNNFGSEKEQSSKETNHLLSDLNLESTKELDLVLSYSEAFSIIKNLVKKQKHKLTSNIRYIVSEDLYMNIINALNDRLVSNILNNLVNKGIVETAFDEKANEFIFWVKNEEKKNVGTNFKQPKAD